MTQRNTALKIEIFRRCFSGLTHVYGTYDPNNGRVRQVKELVTDQVLLEHLRGQQPYGVYLLMQDRIGALAVDFDVDDPRLPLAFVAAAEALGIGASIERSKSKGHHVWIFFEGSGVLAAKARRVVHRILRQIGQPSVEVFPKQDRLDTARQYGNFINAPLFGRLVPQGRSVFLDPANDLRPYPDQWSFLSGIRRVPESLLDDLLESAEPEFVRPVPSEAVAKNNGDGNKGGYGLPPCARRMLAGGVDRYQRVVCFRLAIHLKRLGLPEDLAVTVLKAWAHKNRPLKSGIITEQEIIAQIRSAYRRDYRSYGCEDPLIQTYCQGDCPLRKQDRGGLAASMESKCPPHAAAALEAGTCTSG